MREPVVEENVNERTWLLMVAAWLAGCDGGGAEPMMSEPDAGASMRASVVGEVTYDGAADGALLVGVFPWDEANPSQPMGPPSEFVPADDPSFPFGYELTRIRPGAYFVGAVLDVGRDSPTIPGEEDLEVYTDRIDLEAGQRITIDLSLADD